MKHLGDQFTESQKIQEESEKAKVGTRRLKADLLRKEILVTSLRESLSDLERVSE